jgi:hypothetical protein
MHRIIILLLVGLMVVVCCAGCAPTSLGEIIAHQNDAKKDAAIQGLHQQAHNEEVTIMALPTKIGVDNLYSVTVVNRQTGIAFWALTSEPELKIGDDVTVVTICDKYYWARGNYEGSLTRWATKTPPAAPAKNTGN